MRDEILLLRFLVERQILRKLIMVLKINGFENKDRD
jgi:hypothetical protein